MISRQGRTAVDKSFNKFNGRWRPITEMSGSERDGILAHWPAKPARRQAEERDYRKRHVAASRSVRGAKVSPPRTAARRATNTYVGKRQRLVLEDERTSPSRAAGLGAGIGLVAWGGPRVQMLGPALERGASSAKDARVKNTLIQAERARRAWLTGSQPLGRVGRLGPVSAIGRKIPASMRPGLAVGAGAVLVHRNSPPTKTTRTPVVGYY